MSAPPNLTKQLSLVTTLVIAIGLSASIDSPVMNVYRQHTSPTRLDYAAIPTPIQAGPNAPKQEDKSPAPLRVEFNDKGELTYHGYRIRRRFKRVKLEYPEEHKEPPQWLDASYALVESHGKVVAKFDADIYAGYGNATRFALFPLLGGNMKQLIVSQDVGRGGAQWIASLSARFHLIFDGPAWGVGREGDDMELVDLDRDGIYEITVPITDFYGLQDKMPVAQVPLPTIVFKYDKIAGRYVPANPQFAENSVAGNGTESEAARSSDQFAERSGILAVLLDKVYEGKEVAGWSFFDHAYTLSDKEEVRKRVKSILKDEPVYKFIYKHAHAR